MNNRGLHIVLLALLLLSGASCIRRPKGVKSDSDMVPVIADMTLADIYLRTVSGNSDEQREALTEYVLRKHGMTRAEYDSTMVWYARNTDEYYELTEKVNEQLSRRQRKLKGVSADTEVANDLWPYPRMAVMSPLGAYDGFNFSMATSDVEKGERLKFKMRFNGSIDGDAIFGVEYENGVSSFVTNSLRGPKLEMLLQTDTANTVKRIFMNLTTDNELKKTVWADSISLTALPFDSLQYYQIHSLRRYNPPRRCVPVATDPVAADPVSTDGSRTGGSDRRTGKLKSL